METKKNLIFYTDDDQDDLDFFETASEDIGAEIRVFTIGDKMLKVIKNPPPNATHIFVDLNMPLKSGFEIIEEIKEMSPASTIPIIVLSTGNNEEIIEKCIAAGANYYINKPVSIAALKRAIEHVIQIDWETFKPSPKEFVFKHK